MASLLDLPAALRAAGLSVYVVPEWRTNGHDGQLLLEAPIGLLCHHTADNLGLRSVWDPSGDIRPSVPQPRCNLWQPRDPAVFGAQVAVVSAGRAYHAGTNSSVALAEVRAGQVSAGTADAYPRGLEDDVNGNGVLAGLEVENWGDGQPLTATQLADLPRICAVVLRLYGWTVGHLAHHRQVTRRKPDMYWRGDLWAMTDAVLRGEDDVTAKEMWDYEIPFPSWAKDVPHGQPAYSAGQYLADMSVRTAQLLARETAQDLAITAMAKLVAAPAADLTAEQVEAAVARAIRENTVSVDVSVHGGSAAAPDQPPAGA